MLFSTLHRLFFSARVFWIWRLGLRVSDEYYDLLVLVSPFVRRICQIYIDSYMIQNGSIVLRLFQQINTSTPK